MTRGTEPAHRPHAPDGTLLPLLATAGFISQVATRVCDAMLPALAQAFGASLVEVATTVSAYAIAYGLMQVVSGPLGDRYGKVRVIALACAACSVASVAAALAPTFTVLVLARAAMGAAAAAILPLGLAWIGDTVPLVQRQQVLARYSGITVFGLVLGPLLGGVLAQVWSWRLPFVVVAVLFGSVAVLAWPRLRPQGTSATGRRGDARSLYANPWTRTILCAVGVEMALGIGCLALVPTVLHQRFGMPLSEAGGMAALFGIGGFLFSRCAGTMLRRVRPALMPALGGAIVAGAIALLATMPHSIWAGPACATAGFGFFTLHNTLQLQATQLAPQATGLALSVFTVATFIGQSVGVAAAAAAYARVGAAPVFGAMSAGFLVLGLVVAMLLQRRG